MSAYFVNRTTIDYIVALALWGPEAAYGKAITKPWSVPPTVARLADDRLPIVSLQEAADALGRQQEAADALGRQLWAENARSVAHRYPRAEENAENAKLAAEYTWTPCVVPSDADVGWPTTPKGLIGCLDYQSCEHPGWEASAARAFLIALYDAAVPIAAPVKVIVSRCRNDEDIDNEARYIGQAFDRIPRSDKRAAVGYNGGVLIEHIAGYDLLPPNNGAMIRSLPYPLAYRALVLGFDPREAAGDPSTATF